MKKAFTMIELILVIVVLGIVAGVAINVVKFSYDNEQRTRALNELEIKSQVAIDFISTHLNNSIKNSFRLKKAENSDCANTTTDCKFVFNTREEVVTNRVSSSNFKILEWARMAIKDKRRGVWDGINQTKCVVNKITTTNCYPSTNQFSCFTSSDCNYNISGNYGLYFLGDNIANSTSFMENDLYNLENKIVHFDLNKKNFSMSNAYVLVDNIEGVIFETINKGGNSFNILKFYSYDWKDRNATFSTTDPKYKKSVLVDEVSDFAVYNNGGVTKIKLCLERQNLPGSFIHANTSIKVCKTGVII